MATMIPSSSGNYLKSPIVVLNSSSFSSSKNREEGNAPTSLSHQHAANVDRTANGEVNDIINSNSNSSWTSDQSYQFPPLLRRASTFWPSNEVYEDVLNPDHDSSLRKSSVVIAIFNLVATVCGGGVLTLPIAFSRAGVIPSTIMMIFAAFVTDFSMYILCSCARRTGGKSYGDVTRLAFGKGAEIIVTVMLFIFLCFCIVAYFILVKEIWTPVISYTWPWLENKCTDIFKVDFGNLFLVVFIICSLPLLLKTDFHALRYTCYVGFISCFILVVAVVKEAYKLNFITDVGIYKWNVKLWADSYSDIIYAFPIIVLSFFSIYNVLPVHSALVNPSRERVKLVIHGTVFLCFVLFYVLAIGGYLYAYGETEDNILLNFPLANNMILIGRLGFGFTLMFGLPFIFLPCREALFDIPILIQKWRETKIKVVPEKRYVCKPQNSIKNEGPFVVNGVNFDEERPLLIHNSSITNGKKLMVGKTTESLQDKDGRCYESVPSLKRYGSAPLPRLPKIAETEVAVMKANEDCAKDILQSKKCHYLISTLLLVTFGFIIAVTVPGVAIVWRIAGSSLTMIIGFFIPASCYLKIRSSKLVNVHSIAAWLLVFGSIIASIVCTYNTILDTLSSSTSIE